MVASYISVPPQRRGRSSFSCPTAGLSSQQTVAVFLVPQEEEEEFQCPSRLLGP